MAPLKRGFFLITASSATTVILVQSLMTGKAGMASGLAIGLSAGMGGFGITVPCLLANNFGLPFVMHLLVFLPLAAAIAAPGIPIPEKLRR